VEAEAEALRCSS